MLSFQPIQWALAVGLCLAVAPLWAAKEDIPAYSPRPYEAVYRVRQDGRQAKMRVRLQILKSTEAADGTFWLYTATARILFWKLVNRVQLRWVGKQFQPLRVETRFGKRVQRYDYDWEDGSLVFTDRKGEKTSIALGVSGREVQTMQMEIAGELAQSADWSQWRKTLQLMDGRKARSWKSVTLQVVGTERVTTEAGSFECVHIRAVNAAGEAAGSFYLAPGKNWLPVRSVQPDEGGEAGEDGGRQWELLSLKITDGEA